MGVIMRKTQIFIFSLLLTLLQPAHAAEQLTASMVGQFIKTMNDMRRIADKYDEPDQLGEIGSMDEAMERAAAPFSSSLVIMREYEGYPEFESAISAAGFASVEQWASVGDRVIRAYGAIKMSERAPDLDSQMARAMQQLEDSDMGEAQKQMMREMMQSSTRAVQAYTDAPQADKDAVLPYLAELEAMR